MTTKEFLSLGKMSSQKFINMSVSLSARKPAPAALISRREKARRGGAKSRSRSGVKASSSSSSSQNEKDDDGRLLDRMKVAVASATSAPTAKHVLEALKELSVQEFGLANVKFTEVMGKIDELYDSDAHRFGYSSGIGADGFETENKAGVNMGSNKVFYFAKMHDFTEEMTLRLFCEHYQDVLDTPDGQSHLNIRSFMKNGWAGVRFEGETLRPKGKEGEGERIDQI
jgi:hypothetical protein